MTSNSNNMMFNVWNGKKIDTAEAFNALSDEDRIGLRAHNKAVKKELRKSGELERVNREIKEKRHKEEYERLYGELDREDAKLALEEKKKEMAIKAITDPVLHALEALPKFDGQESVAVERGWNTDDPCFVIKYMSYREPRFEFEHLSRISVALGTRKLNIISDKESNGCGSCGYGALWSITIEAREVNIPLAI